MSLKFGQIQQLISIVTDRVMMEKNSVLFILAGNNDMYESSDEFEFRPDWTTDCGISCS